MEWNKLYEELANIKTKFDRSHKSLTQNRPIQKNTVRKHVEILVECFNEARMLIHDHRERLTQNHWSQVSKLLIRLRTNLIFVKQKFSLELSVPTVLNTPIEVDTAPDPESTEANESESEELPEVNLKIEDEDLNNLTIPAVYTDLDNSTDSDTSSVIENKISNSITMAQSNIDFINTASKLIPVFDGKAENLTSFIDALQIIESIKGEHEELAVSIIKTKLKGVARNLIGNETTITEVISRLRGNVKGETVEVLSAKLMNLQQRNKTANQYTQEIEQMTKALEGAFITDGLSLELARSYSTQHAVKAMTKNCTIDKVKLIMQAGTFSTMNDAVSKFVNSVTEATGQSNTVLYFKNYPQRGSNRGRGNYRGNFRGNHNNYNKNYQNNNRGRGQYRGNSRGGSNSNRGHNGNNQSNVRITQNTNQTTSENTRSPLNTQQ